jgi:hypothetical protein
LADRPDRFRSQDIQRTDLADRQANHAAGIAIDAAMGVEHLHGALMT